MVLKGCSDVRRDFSGVLVAEGRKEHHFTWLMEEKGESISLLTGIMS